MNVMKLVVHQKHGFFKMILCTVNFWWAQNIFVLNLNNFFLLFPLSSFKFLINVRVGPMVGPSGPFITYTFHTIRTNLICPGAFSLCRNGRSRGEEMKKGERGGGRRNKKEKREGKKWKEKRKEREEEDEDAARQQLLEFQVLSLSLSNNWMLPLHSKIASRYLSIPVQIGRHFKPSLDGLLYPMLIR